MEKYKDSKTGWEIRKMDLENVNDIKLFVQANESIVSQFYQACPDAKKDPYYSSEMFLYCEIGLGMAIAWQPELKEEAYVIEENGKPIGTGWVGPLLNIIDIQNPHYPTTNGIELDFPTKKDPVEMYKVMFRMLKARGIDKIYIQIWKGFPKEKFLKKKFIGEFPFGIPERKPLIEVWKLEI